MPKAYILVNAARREDVPAPTVYLERFHKLLAIHGGRVLIGTEQIDQRKGDLKLGRLVVVEFAHKAAAIAAYDEYTKEVMPLRPGGTSDLLIVEGTE